MTLGTLTLRSRSEVSARVRLKALRLASRPGTLERLRERAMPRFVTSSRLRGEESVRERPRDLTSSRSRDEESVRARTRVLTSSRSRAEALARARVEGFATLREG